MSYTSDLTFTYPDASFDLGFNFEYTPMGISDNTPMHQGKTNLQWSNGPMDGFMMDGPNTFDHLNYSPAQASTSQVSQDPWFLNMPQSSLSSGSSSNSGSPSWSWDLSPSTSAPPDLGYPPMNANYALYTPVPTTHDHQEMLSFLNGLQELVSISAHKPKRTPNRARKQVRAVTPRVSCPNFHLCGKTFCRKDVLARHLKKTCGMQCEACTGRIPVGVTCAHHQGAGRPVMPERMMGGWARAAAAPY